MSRIDILVTLRDDAVSICIFCKILESISDKLDSLIWWPLRRKTFFLEVMNYFRFFGKHHWHSLPECPNTTKERNAFGTDMVVALRQKEGISDGRLCFSVNLSLVLGGDAESWCHSSWSDVLTVSAFWRTRIYVTSGCSGKECESCSPGKEKL